MSIIYFADVDDNLVTSSDLVPKEGWVPVVRNERGQVTSYLSPKQRMLFDVMKAGGTIVATTARRVSHYRAVELPFDSYAITTFGGVILQPDGNPEPRWQEHIQTEAAKHNAELNALFAHVNEAIARLNLPEVESIIISEYGTEIFVYWQHKARRIEELKPVKDVLIQALPAGWKFSFNGNFLAAMPPYLGKEKAVRWFLDNIAEPGSLAFGSGDSLTDLPFMAECDYALIPTGSQIHRNLPKGQIEAPKPRGIRARIAAWLVALGNRIGQ